MAKIGQASSQKAVVKISSKSIDYLTANLDLERFEAIRILRENEGSLEKSIEQFLLGQDTLGKPQYEL